MSTQIPNITPQLESVATPLLVASDKDVLADLRSRRLKIGVLGMGHVGLPTALGLADLGWQVLGADSSAVTIDQLRNGKLPFYEPGIEKLLSKHIGKKFRPLTDLEETIREATILFVCVGTPQRENGEADLSQVEAVARTIAQNLNGYKLIVEKSTVPAVTAHWVKRTIVRYARNGNRNGTLVASDCPDSTADPLPVPLDFDVASNPEFLQEGAAIRNIFRPDRIVCGVESERARLILEELYRPLHSTVLVTGLSTAELIKHAANSFLAMKISFINMVADLCELVGADVTKVASGIGMDPRIGPQFLSAGIGFGGYCFPKDLRAFIHLAEEYGLDFSLLKEVENINRRRVDTFLKKVRQALWVLQDKTIAVLGLAFKPNTDDIREAPGLKIVNALLAEGARLRLHDPRAIPTTKAVLPEDGETVVYCEDAYTAAQHAHGLIVLTEWPEYSSLELQRLREAMDVPVVVDGRNVFDPAVMSKLGFEYLCIGR
ncbi:MAG TPA: UDP-glucose/GDP-mannose dehydrogenase family protein [Terriglobales bacterium]|nr:UDP-glucose/GDP-mannose dehydrogenase family protein [Terriglobales bacterium]